MSLINKILIGGVCFIGIALLLSYLIDFLIFTIIIVLIVKLFLVITSKREKNKEARSEK